MTDGLLSPIAPLESSFSQEVAYRSLPILPQRAPISDNFNFNSTIIAPPPPVFLPESAPRWDDDSL